MSGFPSQIGGGPVPTAPYVVPGASTMSFGGAPVGGMGFVGAHEGLSGGAVAGIVFGIAAVVILVLVLAFSFTKPPCPPAARHTGETVTGGQSSHRLASDSTPVPSQYGNGQQAAKKSASEMTLKQLREEHALVGTCEDPQTHLKYSGGFKNNDLGADNEWMIRMLEGDKHPTNQTIKKAHQNGGPPEAPPMPMPLGLYSQSGIGKMMGTCAR